jgi:hypothetical protein
MKKYLTEAKYKRYNQRRAERSLQARLRCIDSARTGNRRKFRADKHERTLRQQYKDYRRVVAPDIFTLLRNTDATISFINTLKGCLNSKQKVFVMLRQIKEIDYDAIVVLVSALVRFKAMNIRFNGDFPKEGECQRMLRQSGFLDIILGNEKFSDTDEYEINPEQKNLISTHGQKIVRADLTASLIENAAQTVWGTKRRCQGIQTALIEMMMNTFAHADPMMEKGKHWWLSINHSDSEKKVRFSFVDYGVGIFKSLETKTPGNKWYGAISKMLEAFRYPNNAKLLDLILQGELHRTVTGEYFRGQGLPGIRECMEAGWLKNLHIISNDVHADVSKGEYVQLRRNFEGTFYYFELDSTCLSYELKQ